ncbi:MULTISPECIES: hypothetical protein [Haloferacaceae]|uniref:Uncharacterized protein n=1 Tax=Halorubrum glutamatedens TaxID=2707018 RepID=A0ABD5QTL7_9EURY|nr:hypothetical protein [Halobellus captivus]
MSDDTEAEILYVAGRQNGGGGSRKAHTTDQCPMLKQANTVLERPRDTFASEPGWCKVCTEGIDRPDSQDVSHYNALVAAASEADQS